MTEEWPLPSYPLRPAMPSLWTLLRHGIADVASVIPASILELPAVQLPGPGAPLVVADPVLIREVLNDRDGRFVRDKFMTRMNRRAWGKGLAAADGEAWQRQRRAAAPAFRPQAVDANGAAFAAAAAKAAQSWPQGEPIELTQRAARIIADIVFTVLVDGQGSVDADAVAADIPAYVRRITNFGTSDLLPIPEAWHDRLRGVDADPAVQRIRALAHQLASQRQSYQKRGDLIDLMLGKGPIEDNIRGLFPAAMETTMGAVSWTLYVLALRPEWQSRVAEEARQCGGEWQLENLPVTRRVVQEVLRLYPPAPLLVRSAVAAGELGGHRLRRSQVVSLHIYAMHRHRTLWDEPDAFDPDRFLPERGQHPGWLPFGFGPRVCIAAQFALAEIAVVVARLLAELELSATGPEPVVSLQVTTKSLNGLHVIARPRS